MNRSRPSPSPGKVVSRETHLLPRGFALGLILAATVPLIVLIFLFMNDVPLGKPGKFLHLYARLTLRRVLSTPVAVGLIFMQVCGIWLLSLAHRQNAQRSANPLAWLMIVASVFGLGLWAWYAPPDHLSQHAFNLHSPSHDGAFAVEGWRMGDLRAYLRDFPRYVLSEEARWGGTRIMSNPPGLTMLACGVRDVHRAAPGVTNALLPTEQMPDLTGIRESMSISLLFGMLLHGAWVLAVAPWYFAARLWLPAAESAAIAICCVFTPTTLMFTPGKDPAQLLTVGLIVWCWLAAIVRRSSVFAVLLGIVMVAALLLSLVHIWVAAVLLAASGFAATSRGTGNAPLAHGRAADVGLALLMSILSAIVAMVALAWVSGFEMWSALPAIAKGQSIVTRGPGSMPYWWQALGVPLFLVFCGPAVWFLGCSAFFTRPDKQAPLLTGAAPNAAHTLSTFSRRTGIGLMVASIVVMLATVGFTNVETPRLWMPFAALIVLGGGIVFFSSVRGPVWLAALLAATQLAGSIGQWTLMDMREAENRLIGDRPVMFGEE